ncbi:hypothetical protein OPU71_05655, partial [Niveibacterium sp. 24ML]|uniref:carbohydrate-binding domain-containing protein n=1 Tax=Niveibacterium sp. 24ML TaxID=2985512 RepID=UPI0022743085
GGTQNDWLDGGNGADSLQGQEGNDTLYGDAWGALDRQAVSSLVLYARGTPAFGVYPTMEVWIDGVKIQSFTVNSTDFAPYSVTAPLGMNARQIDVAFVNDAVDAATAQNRNLYLEKLVVSGREIKANANGNIWDFGAGAGAFDNLNTYAANGSMGDNGAIHVRLQGADYLDGGTGTDSMVGGIGNDIYMVDQAADVIVEYASEGHDDVRSSVSYTLSANLENLTLTGSNAIDGTGNAERNMVVGNNAANRLDGGAGQDTLSGMGGDDTYLVDNGGDFVWENANAGTDTIRSSVTFTIANNVEHMVLTGSAAINGTGNTLANQITGNDAVNSLVGGAGNDTLKGDSSESYAGATQQLSALVIYARGTAVANVLPRVSVRINGVEAYTFDITSTTLQAYIVPADKLGQIARTVDVVFLNDAVSADGKEDRNLFLDRIELNGSTTLRANAEGTIWDNGAIDGKFAKVSDGTLFSNGALRFNLDGSDVLDGGIGADTLVGGLGNDTYKIDNSADSVTEKAGAGIDVVRSTVDYTLTENVELLYLDGTAAQGTGNSLDNTLIGNATANLLKGEGGDDLLHSSGGNDTAYGGLGNDWVYGHDGDDVLYGNDGNDYLEGGAGADVMEGGVGSDTYSGGAGNDTYVFGRGDQADSVTDSDTTVGNTDTVAFGAGITADQLWFRMVGTDLEVSVIGTADKITVKGWSASGAGTKNQIEVFKTADGRTLSNTKVAALVTEMAKLAPPALGTTTLPAAYQTALLPTINANWTSKPAAAIGVLTLEPMNAANQAFAPDLVGCERWPASAPLVAECVRDQRIASLVDAMAAFGAHERAFDRTDTGRLSDYRYGIDRPFAVQP